MKKILIVLSLVTVLTGCNNKPVKNNETNKPNVDINEMPNIEGNENVDINEEGTKVNNSEEFSKTKKFEVYEISNAKMETSKDGRTTFKASVKNTSSTNTSGILVNIILTDKNGNDISKLSTYIRPLNPNETMELNAMIDKDLSNAYNFYFQKK